MRDLVRAVIAVYAVGLGHAAADDSSPSIPPPAPKQQEQLTLEKFGEADKACMEWSDGCAICKRTDTVSFGCSTTGIACLPSTVTCRQRPQGDPKK